MSTFSIHTLSITKFPPAADARALVRLQMDHVSRTIVPAFYRYLQAQDQNAQIEFGNEFVASFEGLVTLFERAEREVVDTGGAAGEGEVKALKQGLGLWVEGGELGMTDVMVGPCSFASIDYEALLMIFYLVGLYRASNVLKHYRGFMMPTGKKFDAWVERLFNHPSFKGTCSTEQLYLDSYERWVMFSSVL